MNVMIKGGYVLSEQSFNVITTKKKLKCVFFLIRKIKLLRVVIKIYTYLENIFTCVKLLFCKMSFCILKFFLILLIVSLDMAP